jgi:hypothetical protein
VSRAESPRELRNRSRIAQAAARLIAEHGLTDWSAAKRKACRELGLPDKEPLPANEEVEQALRDYNSLFRSESQPASLRQQRRLAIEWMQRLSSWQPVLVGGVAAGWATPHSEVRLELEAEDAKAVEMALINAGIDYAVAPGDACELVAGRGKQTIRLQVLTPQQRRNRSRRDDEARLGPRALAALLDGEASANLE